MKNINKGISTHSLYRHQMRKIHKSLFIDGLYDFMEMWQSNIDKSITKDIDPIDYLDLLDIKYEAAEIYQRFLRLFLVTDNDSAGDIIQNLFNDEYYRLLENQYQIVVDYYIKRDMNEKHDLVERVDTLNDAKFLLTKKKFQNRLPSLEGYVKNSLEYFKNKLDLRHLTENSITSKRNSCIDVNGDVNELNTFEIALKHWYLEEQGIEPMIFGKQIGAKYNAKKVEVHLNQIRKLKGFCPEKKGFLQNLINVKSALSEYPEIVKTIDINIDKLT